MSSPQDSKLAKRLAILVLEAGEQGVSELKPALEKILSGRSAKDRKAFLKAFHKAVLREIHKDTLTIESAHPLQPETIRELVDHFSSGRERPVQVVEKTTPELIAGMRIRLGDTVYDASLANNLQALATRIR